VTQPQLPWNSRTASTQSKPGSTSGACRPTHSNQSMLQHWDPRALSNKGPVHNRRCTVVCAEQSHPLGPPNDFRQRRNLPLKQLILHLSHHTSKWPNINLMEIPGNRHLRRHVRHDLPDRFLL
jgi:hypothetical protein